jgi:hypothetical protein
MNMYTGGSTVTMVGDWPEGDEINLDRVPVVGEEFSLASGRRYMVTAVTWMKYDDDSGFYPEVAVKEVPHEG